MTQLQKSLFTLQDKKYQKFQSSLIPTLNPATIIGVRIPILRTFTKQFVKTTPQEQITKFLSSLPHKYYEENLLHGFIIETIKTFDEAIIKEEEFLPYIDNWAVCDTHHSKTFKKNTDKLLPYIKKWLTSNHAYTIRYAINCLMTYYLDEHFDETHLALVAQIKSQEYYVNMMRAWYFATALAKQWDKTIIYIEENKLDKWTHNKTIQKSIESFRITDEKKEYLRKLREK